MIIDHLSPSSCRTLHTCEQKFVFDKTDRVLFQTRDLALGSVFHKYLEACKYDQSLFSEPEFWNQYKDPILDLYDRARLISMMQGYFLHQNPFEEIISIESEQLVDEVRFKGIRDLICKSHGKKWIVDQKTSSKAEAPSIDTIINNPQMMSYAYFAEPDIEGVCYRVTHKPRERPKKNENWIEFAERMAPIQVSSVWVYRHEFNKIKFEQFWAESLQKVLNINPEKPIRNYFACWDCQYKDRCYG